MDRLWRAAINSWKGLLFALRSERAFQQELIVLVIAVPVAFLLSANTTQRFVLIGSVLFLMVVELLNTAIEKLADRLTREHDIEIVTGTLTKEFLKDRPKLQFLIDQTLKIGEGTLYTVARGRKHTVYSTERACPDCGRSFGILDPKMFSYNSSQGWCEECRGFGETFYLPEVDRGARADAIEESWFDWQEGKREKCPSCQGARLNSVARAVRLHFGSERKYKPVKKYEDGLSSEFPGVDFFSQATVAEALEYFSGLKLDGRQAQIARAAPPNTIHRQVVKCTRTIDVCVCDESSAGGAAILHNDDLKAPVGLLAQATERRAQQFPPTPKRPHDDAHQRRKAHGARFLPSGASSLKGGNGATSRGGDLPGLLHRPGAKLLEHAFYTRRFVEFFPYARFDLSFRRRPLRLGRWLETRLRSVELAKGGVSHGLHVWQTH